MESVIEVQGLSRRFGKVVAVDHIDFAVHREEIFGFLGPNGAGKSTTVRMLTGYIPPSDGKAWIAGHDIAIEPIPARQHLSVVPEEANVYQDLTVWQNMMLMAELHSIPKARRQLRAEELLNLFGLADRREQKGRFLSKGLRQRLMLCMALVSDPDILFLDEPTSGLDVASTRTIREQISRLNREQGMTIFLTTHNIDEADQLCHRLAIINKGRIAAIDTPASLRNTIESRRSVEVTFAGQKPEAADLSDLAGDNQPVPVNNGFRIYSPQPGRIAQEIAMRATERGIRIETICTQIPSLEEVFLSITAKADHTPTPMDMTSLRSERKGCK